MNAHKPVAAHLVSAAVPSTLPRRRLLSEPLRRDILLLASALWTLHRRPIDHGNLTRALGLSDTAADRCLNALYQSRDLRYTATGYRLTAKGRGYAEMVKRQGGQTARDERPSADRQP